MVVAILVALGLAGLSGCGGGEGDGDRDPLDATGEPAVGEGTNPAETGDVPTGDRGSPPTSPAIGDVVWASAVDPATNAPTERVERFSTDAERLYAAVEVSGLPAGVVVGGAWTYNGVALDGLTAEVAVTEAPAGAAWIEFHLERTAESWPEGTYEIAIDVDGEVRRTASVEVAGTG